jgi:hypothetical protein
MIDVEAFVASELERVLPLPDGGRADWGDVMRRAGLMRARRRWRPILVAAVAVAALVGVGVAIAAGFGAFNGISAAQHLQTGADRIDPATRAYMEHGSQPIIKGLRFNTARHVGQLRGGQNVYVLARSGANDNLCFVIGPPGPEWNCSSTLSRRHPSTAFVYTQGGKPWSTVGIALDGVTAVSFKVGGRELGGKEVGGHEVTVPVKNNIWTYTSRNFQSLGQATFVLTAHFADGTAAVDKCPGC